MDVMVILLRCVVSFKGLVVDNDGLVWSRMTFDSNERELKMVREIVLRLFRIRRRKLGVAQSKRPLSHVAVW